jgi:hypothetical protein
LKRLEQQTYKLGDLRLSENENEWSIGISSPDTVIDASSLANIIGRTVYPEEVSHFCWIRRSNATQSFEEGERYISASVVYYGGRIIEQRRWV